MKHLNIVLTGGHAATTALATIEALREEKEAKWNISWIGSSKATEGGNAKTLEFKIFPKYQIACYDLITGRLQRKWSKYSLISLAKIPVGFVHAFFLLLKLKPQVVISFGGFAAFPVVFSAFVLGIPVVLHEQTMAVGLANKYSIPFAKKIAISREESKQYFPLQKTVLTGNPVRKEFFEIKRKTRLKSRPIIYATGGSRGSLNFNRALIEILPELLRKYKVIHQTGDIDNNFCLTFKRSLTQKLKDNYEIHATVDPLDVPGIFRKADMVIGRAGANTVAEVMAAHKPSVFMPIPWSRYNEQEKNAELGVKAGLSKIVNQNTTTQEEFLESIEEVFSNWEKIMKLRESSIVALDKKASTNLSELALSLAK